MGAVVLEEQPPQHVVLLMRPPDAQDGPTSTSVSYDWTRVPEGSRIRGTVECAAAAATCQMQARILYDTARSTVELLEEFELAGGEVRQVDVPLFGLEGQNVRFILQVRADTNEHAIAAWENVALVVP